MSRVKVASVVSAMPRRWCFFWVLIIKKQIQRIIQGLHLRTITALLVDVQRQTSNSFSQDTHA